MNAADMDRKRTEFEILAACFAAFWRRPRSVHGAKAQDATEIFFTLPASSISRTRVPLLVTFQLALLGLFD